MKRIHIIGAGGPAGIGMARCLKDTNYEIFGKDESQWSELLMECPTFEESQDVHDCDLILPIPDGAVAKYADCDLCFLPPKEQIELCQDKAKLAQVLGDLAPKTYWVRDTKGAGGQGAHMASEYLPGRNFSVEYCFKDNKLIGAFQKERLSYLVKEREPNVTASGSSAVSVCTNNFDVYATAADALRRLDDYTNTTHKNLNGFYGVDLKEDENGVPKVTEINAGRLLTASYVYFYKTNYNLALAGVKSFLNEPYELGEYPEGWGIIRQIDKEPKLFHPEETRSWYEVD